MFVINASKTQNDLASKRGDVNDHAGSISAHDNLKSNIASLIQATTPEQGHNLIGAPNSADLGANTSSNIIEIGNQYDTYPLDKSAEDANYELGENFTATSSRGPVLVATVENVLFTNYGKIAVPQDDHAGIDTGGLAGGIFTNSGVIGGNGPAFNSGESVDDCGLITFEVLSGTVYSLASPAILYVSSHTFNLVVDVASDNPLELSSISGNVEIFGGQGNNIQFTGFETFDGDLIAENSSGDITFLGSLPGVLQEVQGIQLGRYADYNILLSAVQVDEIALGAKSTSTIETCAETKVAKIAAKGGTHTVTVGAATEITDITTSKRAVLDLTNNGIVSGDVYIAVGDIVNQGYISGNFTYDGSSFLNADGNIDADLYFGGTDLTFTNSAQNAAASINFATGMNLDLDNNGTLNSNVLADGVTACVQNSGTTAGTMSFTDSSVTYDQYGTQGSAITATNSEFNLQHLQGAVSGDMTFNGGQTSITSEAAVTSDSLTFNGGQSEFTNAADGTVNSTVFAYDNGAIGCLHNIGTMMTDIGISASANVTITNDGHMLGDPNLVDAGRHLVDEAEATFYQNGTYEMDLEANNNSTVTFNNTGVMTRNITFDSSTFDFTNSGTVSGDMTFTDGQTSITSEATLTSHSLTFNGGESEFTNAEDGTVNSSVFSYENGAIGCLHNIGTMMTDIGISASANVTITNDGHMLGDPNLVDAGRHLVDEAEATFHQNGTYEMDLEVNNNSCVTFNNTSAMTREITINNSTFNFVNSGTVEGELALSNDSLAYITNSNTILGDMNFNGSEAYIDNDFIMAGSINIANTEGTLTNNGAIGDGITLAGAGTDYVINTFNGTISGAITSTNATVDLSGGASSLVIDATGGSFSFSLMHDGETYEDLYDVNSRDDKYLNYQGTDTDDISFLYDGEFYSTAEKGLKAMIYEFVGNGGLMVPSDDSYELLFNGGGSLVIAGSGVNPFGDLGDYLM